MEKGGKKAMNELYKCTKEDAIPVVVILFHDLPDYILSADQYKEAGGWKGVIQNHGIHLRDIKGKVTGKMDFVEFNTLSAWEG